MNNMMGVGNQMNQMNQQQMGIMPQQSTGMNYSILFRFHIVITVELCTVDRLHNCNSCNSTIL